MKLHVTEEWMKKKLAEVGDENCEVDSRFVPERSHMSHKHDHEITPFLDVFHAQLNREIEQVKERLLGKRYKINIVHDEHINGQLVSLKDTIQIVSYVSWNTHTGFAVRANEHRVYIHVGDITFLAD
jgi:hypothetical protein